MKKLLFLVLLMGNGVLAQSLPTEDSSKFAKHAAASFSEFSQANERFDFLAENCIDCHNAEDWAGSLAFDLMTPAQIPDHPEIWEKVISKLQGRMMPPAGQARPDNAKTDEFITWMEAYLDHAASLEQHVGRIGLHRLNRKEYANAVRDLFDLKINAESLLPTDASVEGFDNVAAALRASPSFIEQSLSAARVIMSQAIGNPSPRPGGSTYAAKGDQYKHIAGLPLGTRGGLLVEHYFPADGQYVLNIGNLAAALWVTSQEFTHTLIATLDGVKFFELDIGGGKDLKAIDQIGDPAVDAINKQLKNIKFYAKAGPHKLAVTFIHRSFAESEKTLHSMTPQDGASVIRLGSIEVQGPFEPKGLSQTPSRKKIFTCYPESSVDELDCANNILAKFVSLGYRGYDTSDDLERLEKLYIEHAANEGFESGVRHALTAMLASPKFLYRSESVPEGSEPGSIHSLSDLDLASRLSFFLWSSIPDNELLDLARRGELSKPAILDAQVDRMLGDPRAVSLSDNFAYQWLNLAAIDEVDPDPDLFRDLDSGIRDLLKTEVRLFVRDIFLNDRSVLDLLTSHETWLNERLALHYDIQGVKGDEFRLVSLADLNYRYGLLGKGAVLMASSYPDRTSPVLRGAYVLEYIMGTPPPNPPPNVEALVDNTPGTKQMTIKERLELHRNSPTCAGCHGFIDPLGFALENFDSVGRYRTIDRSVGRPVDTSAQLPDGKPLSGVVELREAILERPYLFVENLTQSLLLYALGREIEAQDMPLVRHIVADSAQSNYDFYSIVRGIISSDQFRYVVAPQRNAATDQQKTTVVLAADNF
jgi:hypothetical protein